jgi:hypothetical protein
MEEAMALSRKELLGLARDGAAARIAMLRAEIARIRQSFPGLTVAGAAGDAPSPFRRGGRPSASPKRRRRRMSKEARKRISEAQKKRWAEQKKKAGKK